jgi:MFS family permease
MSAACIVLLPGMWLVSSDFRYLVGVQVFSGAVWGANDLAVLLLFFETIPREKRINILTVFNLANAVATAAGSLLGGALLLVLGTTGQAYLLLFALSTVARAAALLLLVRVPASAGARWLRTVRLAIPQPHAAGADDLPRPRYLQGPHWRRRIAPPKSPLIVSEPDSLARASRP